MLLAGWLGIVPPCRCLLWGQSSQCHSTSGLVGVLLCVDGWTGGVGWRWQCPKHTPSPSHPPLKNRKRKKEKKEKCHWKITVTPLSPWRCPAGSTGAGLAGAEWLKGKVGGGWTPLPFLFSLSLSLSYPPSSSQTPCFPWWLAHPVVNAKRPNLQLWGGGCRETDPQRVTIHNLGWEQTDTHKHKVLFIVLFLLWNDQQRYTSQCCSTLSQRLLLCCITNAFKLNYLTLHLLLSKLCFWLRVTAIRFKNNFSLLH